MYPLQLHLLSRLSTAAILATCVVLSGCATVGDEFFAVRFVDEQTGRGVPLVEIESTHGVKYISDSAGYIAINRVTSREGVMYFSVRSHGYEIDKDRYGWQGIRLHLARELQKVVPMRRTNIAERLYRVTGEGIYHHSTLLDLPFSRTIGDQPRGGVFGQDSVVNAIYDGKLYWFWGDTSRAETRLGNFKVSGATSSLPVPGSPEAELGIELDYFVGPGGFSRAMCPIEGPGVVWISGLAVVQDNVHERMICHYSRRAGMGEQYEHGIAVWDDEHQRFEKAVEFPEGELKHPYGHTLPQQVEGEPWLYFGHGLPEVRVRARMEDILDPGQYQAYTFMQEGKEWDIENPAIDRDANGELAWAWRYDAERVDLHRWRALRFRGLVESHENRQSLVDATSGRRIHVHNGHIAWSEHRQRWLLVAGEFIGENSLLGDIWYAESPSPMGPWSKAMRIVSHNNYSFYNVKQHPYYAADNFIYFEGTYTKSFSRTKEPTPRYNYNQIMYRLDLDDPRLAAVRAAGDGPDGTSSP
ncbi:MAG: hypothetical protein R3228_10630 [Halioglobus sp.]|nr:hypothetical protein [Halioglobus sp.]